MRAVEHRIILVDRRVRLLAAENKARYFRRTADALRKQLVDAGAGADFAARSERRARQEIAGLRAVDVSLQRLGVEEPANEKHF